MASRASSQEIKQSQSKQNIGKKRAGIELEGPPNKKRRLNDTETENGKNDDANHNKSPKRRRRRRNKKNDEPSKANKLIDPVHHCEIDQNKECKLSIFEYIEQFELLTEDDINIQKEQIKYVNMAQIEKYLQTTANENGYTIQNGVANIFCLGLKDHLKNMFDEMNTWRNNRIDARMRQQYQISYDGINSQEWIDEINEKYATKQAIVESKDEIEAWEAEREDLDFKKVTGILTDEEEKRRDKLDRLIRQAHAKQNKDNESKQNQFAMQAMGGDFSFNFNNSNTKQSNTIKKRKERVLHPDKFYVIDIINMMENHQQYSQQHLHQLAKLYKKQT